MAIQQAPYSFTQYHRLPEWLKRSWSIFDRVRIRADFKKDLDDTHERLAQGAERSVEVIRILKTYSLGQGMDQLIIACLENKDITDEALLNMIPPPVRFLNHGFKVIIPAADPQAAYNDNERAREAVKKISDIDIATSKEVTYLVIPPGISKDELKNFIDEYYEELQTAIQGTQELYFESARNTSKRIRRVSPDEIIDERMHELKTMGHKTASIARVIEKEFGRQFTAPEIAKRELQMRRRKNRQ
ncbi:hypothetical protein JNJ66_06135 [Candidatus Saccharibacteria bacterium]|nr:hypothetical protein [Candidatus Saccharibacteria bacterium]